jgi:hypothetical protein
MAFCCQLGYRRGSYLESLRIEAADIDAHPGSLLHCLLHSAFEQAALGSLSVHCGVVMLELDDVWQLQAGDSEEAVVTLAAQLVAELYRLVGGCLQLLGSLCSTHLLIPVCLCSVPAAQEQGRAAAA